MSSRVVLLLVGAFLSIAPVRGAHGSVCYDCLCRVRELGFYVDGLPDSYDCTLPGPVPPPIVVLDASSSYSGDDAINAQTGATWTMTHNLDGPSPCARNQHLGVDVFDLEDPYCGLESTERLDYCGSSFGWTTADWIDIRDDVSTYGTRTFHATTNGVLVITRERKRSTRLCRQLVGIHPELLLPPGPRVESRRRRRAGYGLRRGGRNDELLRGHTHVAPRARGNDRQVGGKRGANPLIRKLGPGKVGGVARLGSSVDLQRDRDDVARHLPKVPVKARRISAVIPEHAMWRETSPKFK